MVDYYEILGINRNASKDEIKSAFRKKARLYHPDVNKEADAEEKFKQLGKAYETLMDDNKRSVYDRYGEDGLQSAGFDQSGPFDFGFGNLNDIFESFFGGFGGFGEGVSGRGSSSKRGADLRIDVELDFEQAVFGVEKEIEIKHLETCPRCKGSGCEPGTSVKVCPTCKGHGQVQQTMRTPLGNFTQIGTCPDCKGSGQKIETPCKQCFGNERVEVKKTIKVKIPAGVDDGSKIRVSKEGNSGKNGGSNGDLYIVLFVKPHKVFKRDGYNIISNIDVSIPQAVLGDEIMVQTLEGEKRLTIPKGTQSGKVLSMKSSGVPVLGSSSQRGEHLFYVNVIVPTKINDEERKLYQRLLEINRYKKESTAEKLIDKVKGVLQN